MRWTRLGNLAIVLLVLLGIAVAVVPTSSTGARGGGGGGGGGGKRPQVSYAARAEASRMAPLAWLGPAIDHSAASGTEALA